MEPLVRRIRPGDGPRIRALRLEMLADTPIAFSETLATAEQDPVERWAAQAERNATSDEHATFVAEQDGRFVATASGMVSDGRAYLVSVYITPGQRGGGLVDRLVEEVATWALAGGHRELVLDVAAENPRAIAAYARLGFVLTGASAPHPLYAGVTELEMVRPADLLSRQPDAGPR